MTRSTIRAFLIAVAALCFLQSRSTATAQEAMSTTTTSSESTATSSTNTTSSTESGAELSAPANAPSGAVTGSGTSTPEIQRNPSSAGVFSPTPLQIYATLSGGYDDNVSNTKTDKQSSGFTNANAILDYTFGDPRLQLDLNAGAAGTYYFSHVSNQNYDIDFKGALGITYKATPRLALGGTLLVDYLTEPSFEYAGGLNSRNGNYLYTTDKGFLHYTLTQRFATKTSYTFEAYNYDNNAVGVFSDRISNLFGNEVRFQW